MKHGINPYRHGAMRASLAEWLGSSAFTHALTLNVNQRRELTVRGIAPYFKRFCHEIDRTKLKRLRVHQHPFSERFHAIAVPEKLLSFPHLHLVADLRFLDQRGCSDCEIEGVVSGAWLKATMRTGSVNVQRLSGLQWPWYITKEPTALDDYLLASDFHPG